MSKASHVGNGAASQSAIWCIPYSSKKPAMIQPSARHKR